MNDDLSYPKYEVWLQYFILSSEIWISVKLVLKENIIYTDITDIGCDFIFLFLFLCLFYIFCYYKNSCILEVGVIMILFNPS